MRRRIDLRREDGVAMTEFALIVPVFLLIVVGLLAFGRVFFYWIEANHLANETARWAVVDRNPYSTRPRGRSQKYARAEARRSSSTTTSKVCITYIGPAARRPRRAAAGEGPKPFSFLPLLGIGTITIRGSSTMRIERFAEQHRPADRRTLGSQRLRECCT